MQQSHSKLDYQGQRLNITATEAIEAMMVIFTALGCEEDIAESTALHLADSSLCGVESHGVMRCLQYAEQFKSGYLDAKARPCLMVDDRGHSVVDGMGGIGIPAMNMAYDQLTNDAIDKSIAMMAVKNVGHTGRHGAYADRAAEAGVMTFLIGGGNRAEWRQVAPHGGAKAKLPTNPYCIGFPGGQHGAVVIDLATSKIAGGWIYAASNAGAKLPKDCVIDRDGKATVDPEDYFAGGAILPSGGAKGYALGLMAELVADALLGPVDTECNWLLIAIDTRRYRGADEIKRMSEVVLADMRDCPPAPGFSRVEIPGERERDHRERSNGKIAIPTETWRDITELAAKLEN